jgi:hypothetical protein
MRWFTVLREWIRRKFSKAIVLAPLAPREGLRQGFVVGEGIPLKGILFRVSYVEPKLLHLEPMGMTAKRAKRVKGARRG